MASTRNISQSQRVRTPRCTCGATPERIRKHDSGVVCDTLALLEVSVYGPPPLRAELSPVPT
eukprot:4785843-Prymnesium_polylepis.1